MNITAVIVTFNRKNDLLRCVEAVLGQSRKPDNVVIVNNASTDGTEEALLERFGPGQAVPGQDAAGQAVPGQDAAGQDAAGSGRLRLLGSSGPTAVHLYSSGRNTGGAGGFHVGMRLAHERLESDFVWLMDDDGYPTKDCLEQLLAHTEKHDYIMPASVNIVNHSELSWPVRMKDGRKTDSYEELQASWGEILAYVTPFNGVLLSRHCVEKAGYVNKDFFIWGDDYEHYYRCKAHGIEPVTLLPAVFYHPAQKVMLKRICFGLFSLAYSDSPLRMFCLARNWTYIYRHYNQRWKIPVKWLMYWWLFMVTRRGDRAGWRLYRAAVKDGFREDFSGHLRYVNGPPD